MKWTVLSDNRTTDSRLQTEHGLSVLLETGQYRILLDTGASDVFIRNAETLGIDLSTVDYVFISHGHSDHAGGLRHLLRINDRARIIVAPSAPTPGSTPATARATKSLPPSRPSWATSSEAFPHDTRLSCRHPHQNDISMTAGAGTFHEQRPFRPNQLKKHVIYAFLSSR